MGFTAHGLRILTLLALQRCSTGKQRFSTGKPNEPPLPRLPIRQRIAYHVLHRFSRGELVEPKVVVFMAGLPGAGKTTIINRRYQPSSRWSSTVVLDLDSEMCSHPRYDPADPDQIYTERGNAPYAWADKRIEAKFVTALAAAPSSRCWKRRIVLDGTGTNSERQVRRMRAAQEAGWFVKVLYVNIPLETAVRRAARRTRPVSATKIFRYQARIDEALVAMAELADEFELFDAPSHDPPHVLMKEGYVDKSRLHLGRDLTEAELAHGHTQAELAHARARREARRRAE